MPLHLREDYTARRVDIGARAVPYSTCTCRGWVSTDADPASRGCGYLAHLVTVASDAEIAGVIARATWHNEHPDAPAWDDLPPHTWTTMIDRAFPYARALRLLLTPR